MSAAAWNRSSLLEAIAYAEDQARLGVYGADLDDFTRCARKFRSLSHAGATFRGNPLGIYPSYAFVHHVNNARTVDKYSANAWSFAVYTREQFTEYAASGRITTTLENAVVVSHASVTSKSFLAPRHGREFVVPFQRFKAARIPTSGYWVLVVRDVDQPSNPPEIIAREYELTSEEVALIHRHGSGVLLPLNVPAPQHVHQLRAVNVPLTRLLWNVVAIPADGFVDLVGASMQLIVDTGDALLYGPSVIGDTVDSVRDIGPPVFGQPAPPPREPATPFAQPPKPPPRTPDTPHTRGSATKAAVAAVISAQGITEFGGFYASREGIVPLGEIPSGRLASAALAEAAIAIGVRRFIAANAERIMEHLNTVDRMWFEASSDRMVSMYHARGGLEALFLATSSSGAASPVLRELKRIFGDIGLPTLDGMLNGESGLAMAPSAEDAQRAIDNVLATKVDLDVERGPLLTEAYLASVLARVSRPDWRPQMSPLATAVLVSAAGDEFVNHATAALRDDLGMTHAVLRYARAQRGTEDAAVRWTGRVAPGVYVDAPLVDYSAAAQRMASTPVRSVLREVIVAKVFADPDAVDAALGDKKEIRAGDAYVVGSAAAGRVIFADLAAITAPSTDTKLKAADRGEIVSFGVVKDTAHTGVSVALVFERATAQSVAVQFRAADRGAREAMLRALITSLVADPRDYPRRGTDAQPTGNFMAALIASKGIQRFAKSQAVSSAATKSTSTRLSRDALLRAMLEHKKASRYYLPLSGGMDAREVTLANVDDTTGAFALVYRGGNSYEEQVDGAVDATTGKARLTESGARVKFGTAKFEHNSRVQTVQTMSIGPHMYADSESLETLNAAQNMRIKPVFAAATASATDTNTPHDPYNVHGKAPVSNTVAANNGVRRTLLVNGSLLVPQGLGTKRTTGPITSYSQRSDSSNYFAGARDSWVSPYAAV